MADDILTKSTSNPEQPPATIEEKRADYEAFIQDLARKRFPVFSKGLLCLYWLMLIPAILLMVYGMASLFWISPETPHFWLKISAFLLGFFLLVFSFHQTGKNKNASDKQREFINYGGWFMSAYKKIFLPEDMPDYAHSRAKDILQNYDLEQLKHMAPAAQRHERTIRMMLEKYPHIEENHELLQQMRDAIPFMDEGHRSNVVGVVSLLNKAADEDKSSQIFLDFLRDVDKRWYIENRSSRFQGH